MRPGGRLQASPTRRRPLTPEKTAGRGWSGDRRGPSPPPRGRPASPRRALSHESIMMSPPRRGLSPLFGRTMSPLGVPVKRFQDLDLEMPLHPPSRRGPQRKRSPGTRSSSRSFDGSVDRKMERRKARQASPDYLSPSPDRMRKDLIAAMNEDKKYRQKEPRKEYSRYDSIDEEEKKGPKARLSPDSSSDHPTAD